MPAGRLALPGGQQVGEEYHQGRASQGPVRGELPFQHCRQETPMALTPEQEECR